MPPRPLRRLPQLEARKTALENCVFFAVANRCGEERGFRFIGRSRVLDVAGIVLASASEEGEEIVYAEIDPEKARRKRIVHIPGKYELDRIAHRRPEMYGPLTEAKSSEGKRS